MKAWIAASLALALSACATGKAEVPYCVQRYTGGECNCDTGLFGTTTLIHGVTKTLAGATVAPPPAEAERRAAVVAAEAAPPRRDGHDVAAHVRASVDPPVRRPVVGAERVVGRRRRLTQVGLDAVERRGRARVARVEHER